jgi:hypothetical protein
VENETGEPDRHRPSRNYLGIKPLTLEQLGIRPLTLEQMGLKPLTPKQLGIKPLTLEQMGLKPLTPKQLGIKPLTLEQLGIKPLTLDELGITPLKASRLRISSISTHEVEISALLARTGIDGVAVRDAAVGMTAGGWTAALARDLQVVADELEDDEAVVPLAIGDALPDDDPGVLEWLAAITPPAQAVLYFLVLNALNEFAKLALVMADSPLPPEYVQATALLLALLAVIADRIKASDSDAAQDED